MKGKCFIHGDNYDPDCVICTTPETQDSTQKAEPKTITKEQFVEKFEELYQQYNTKSPGTLYHLFDSVVAPLQQEIAELKKECDEMYAKYNALGIKWDESLERWQERDMKELNKRKTIEGLPVRFATWVIVKGWEIEKAGKNMGMYLNIGYDDDRYWTMEELFKKYTAALSGESQPLIVGSTVTAHAIIEGSMYKNNGCWYEAKDGKWVIIDEKTALEKIDAPKLDDGRIYLSGESGTKTEETKS